MASAKRGSLRSATYSGPSSTPRDGRLDSATPTGFMTPSPSLSHRQLTRLRDDPFSSNGGTGSPLGPGDRPTPNGLRKKVSLGTPGQRRAAGTPRLVKRRGFVEKMQDLPSDIYLSLLADWTLLDLAPFGYTCGIILNALHLLVRFSVLVYASRQAKSYRAGRSWFDIAIGRNQNVLTAADERLEEIRRLKMGLRGVDGGDGWWGWNLGNVITFTLILISFANAAYVLTRRKEYQMHLRKDPLSSPNAKFIDADLVDPSDRDQSWSTWILDQIKEFFFQLLPFLRSLFGADRQEIKLGVDGRPRIRKVHQLDIWAPPEFGLRVLSLYPPPVAFMWHFLSANNWFAMLTVMAMTVAQTWLLCFKFTHLVKDKQLLSAEVLHEYDSKFVNPRVNPRRKDAATSTSEAEMITRSDLVAPSFSYQPQSGYGADSAIPTSASRDSVYQSVGSGNEDVDWDKSFDRTKARDSLPVGGSNWRLDRPSTSNLRFGEEYLDQTPDQDQDQDQEEVAVESGPSRKTRVKNPKSTPARAASGRRVLDLGEEASRSGTEDTEDGAMEVRGLASGSSSRRESSRRRVR